MCIDISSLGGGWNKSEGWVEKIGKFNKRGGGDAYLALESTHLSPTEMINLKYQSTFCIEIMQKITLEQKSFKESLQLSPSKNVQQQN